MTNAYGIMKVLHILAVILWIGGLAGLVAAMWRISREAGRQESDRRLISGLTSQIVWFAQLVVGPAAGVVLLAGLGMVGMAHLGFGTLWVLIGYGGILVHGLVGGLMLRKRSLEVIRIAGADERAYAALGATALSDALLRLRQAQILYFVLMACVVAAMILKPTL